jgi:hypothetical protein
MWQKSKANKRARQAAARKSKKASSISGQIEVLESQVDQSKSDMIRTLSEKPKTVIPSTAIPNPSATAEKQTATIPTKDHMQKTSRPIHRPQPNPVYVHQSMLPLQRHQWRYLLNRSKAQARRYSFQFHCQPLNSAKTGGESSNVGPMRTWLTYMFMDTTAKH